MKLKLTVILFLISVSLLSAQSVTLVFPKAGDAWIRGSQKDIAWHVVGDVSGTWKLTLWRGGTSLGVIATGIPSTQKHFLWTVGKLENAPDAAYGPGYTIKVRLQGLAVSDVSDSFSISRLLIKKTAPRVDFKKTAVKPSLVSWTIKVTKPVEGGRFQAGLPVDINWNTAIGSDQKVNVYLYDAKTHKKEETIALNHANNGHAVWQADQKYSWPGTELYVKIATADGKISGKSGVFSVFFKAPEKKEVVLAGQIDNRDTHSFNNHPQADCMSVSLPLPGRAAEGDEVKSGHFKREGKQGKCYWGMKYFFSSQVTFDLSALKGKEIKRAEMQLDYSDFVMMSPSGTLATNEYCNSESLVTKDGKTLTSISLFGPGDVAKVDLLQEVSQWAASGSGDFALLIKGKLDSVPYSNSVCLKYYRNPRLVVEYME